MMAGQVVDYALWVLPFRNALSPLLWQANARKDKPVTTGGISHINNVEPLAESKEAYGNKL